MDSKSLVVFAFILGHSFNVTSIEILPGQIPEELWEKVFAVGTGEKITQYLSNRDLLHMATDTAMLHAANFELNRRSKILHYRDGKINPPFLANRLKYKPQYIDMDINEFDYYWSGNKALLFGEENPINIVNITYPIDVYMVTSYKNHLKFSAKTVFDSNFVPKEIKGSPMNGVIFPSLFISHFLTVQPYTHKILHYQRVYSEYYGVMNNETNLIIMIISDDGIDRKRIKNRISMEIKSFRKDFGIIAPICVVAQSDIRDQNIRKFERFQNFYTVDGLKLVFHGPDTRASALVIDTEDELTLKRKFQNWKENLDFLDSHQTIAFHFTIINGNEPGNSEEIFSDIFKNIPLNTLHLHGGPSIIGIDYQAKNMKSNFKTGPVYAIVGIRKFGC